MGDKTYEALQEELDEWKSKADSAEEEAWACQKEVEKAEERVQELKDQIRREKEEVLSLLYRLEHPTGYCLICGAILVSYSNPKKRSHLPGCELRIKIMEIETAVLVKRLCVD